MAYYDDEEKDSDLMESKAEEVLGEEGDSEEGDLGTGTGDKEEEAGWE